MESDSNGTEAEIDDESEMEVTYEPYHQCSRYKRKKTVFLEEIKQEIFSFESNLTRIGLRNKCKECLT